MAGRVNVVTLGGAGGVQGEWEGVWENTWHNYMPTECSQPSVQQ